MQTLQEIQNAIKRGCLLLNPTGAEGFEGLLASALSSTLGLAFRLAASGYQFGIDGASDDETVLFEGKLYTRKIPPNEVKAKIGDRARAKNEIDAVWLLCATVEVDAKLATAVRTEGEERGLFVEILDWSGSTLKPLATALAMGKEGVASFVESSDRFDKKATTELIDALEALRNLPSFSDHANELKVKLCAPSSALRHARRANQEFLSRALEEPVDARQVFGQAIVPSDAGPTPVQKRPSLTTKISASFTDRSDGAVTVVHGAEGCGKSWLAMCAWKEQQEAPTTLFISAEQISSHAKALSDPTALIDHIILQTSDSTTSVSRERWKRRFEWMRQNVAELKPRIVVILDGINQRVASHWHQAIDELASLLSKLGGTLIVTVRTEFYRTNIKNRLLTPIKEIQVLDWSDQERDAILTRRGLSASELTSSTAKALLNPRLLGVALQIFTNEQLRSLKELDSSRLMFEHIRMSERDQASADSFDEFVDRLKQHANRILERYNRQYRDDLLIFEDDAPAVAEGRFFRTLPDTPKLYTLEEPGLHLALGLGLIDKLQKAKRNGKTLSTASAELIEPISAIDDTAKVVMAALTVATLDERLTDSEIGAELVTQFVQTQNPHDDLFPAFCALGRQSPHMLLDSAEALRLGGETPINADWLDYALIHASCDQTAWRTIEHRVRKWLRTYTKSPGFKVFGGHDEEGRKRRADQIEKNRERVERNVAEMSAAEANYLSKLEEVNGDVVELWELAVALLAGKPLASFSEEIVARCYSASINPYSSSYQLNVTALGRFNVIDWPDMRKALLAASRWLRAPYISSTGQWALVRVLNVIGSVESDDEANLIATELRKDENWPSGWRRVEGFCSTDPCDPSSIKPENIDNAVKRIRSIDAVNFSGNRSYDDARRALDGAMIAVARFHPKTLIAKIREIIADILSREGDSLRYAIYWLHEHPAIVSPEEAKSFVQLGSLPSVASPSVTKRISNDEVVHQFALILGFPQISANEQLQTLLSRQGGSALLFDLLDFCKKPDEQVFDDFFQQAVFDNDEAQLEILLSFAWAVNFEFTESGRESLMGLLSHPCKAVRHMAIMAAGNNTDRKVLEAFLGTDTRWDAQDNLRSSESNWAGHLLLQSFQTDLIDSGSLVDRLSPALYGDAIRTTSPKVISIVAKRIDQMLDKIFGIDLPAPTTDIEVRFRRDLSATTSQIYTRDRDPDEVDVATQVVRFNESEEEFLQRQELAWQRTEAFFADLSRAGAGELLGYLGSNALRTIYAADRKRVLNWAAKLLKLQTVHPGIYANFQSSIAYALAEHDEPITRQLLDGLRNVRPSITFSIGLSHLDAQTYEAWLGSDSETLLKHRTGRLDGASTDHAIAQEVLAAELGGKSEFLTRYIKTNVSSPEPSRIARALMVAGFMNDNETSEEVLGQFSHSTGFIATAHRAALYAYERNIWARHWFGEMCTASSNETFWCAQILFEKVVDGRFELWCNSLEDLNASFQLFEPCLPQLVRGRVKKWHKKRTDNLFGHRAPHAVFLGLPEILA